MISHNKYVVIDFETTALDPNKNQPVSMAAVMIDGRKLTLCDQGTFYSTINYIPDSEVETYNLSKSEKKAMDIHGISLDTLKSSPSLKNVWNNFCNWMKLHTPKNDQWEYPIFCGHNNLYDKTIVNRIMHGHLEGKQILTSKLLTKTKISKMDDHELAYEYTQLSCYKEPWKYGPENLFHPVLSIDTYSAMFALFENCREPQKLSLTALRSFFGFNSEDAHNALVDTLYSAEILIRYLRLLRMVSKDTDFNVNGEAILPIEKIVKELKECPF